MKELVQRITQHYSQVPRQLLPALSQLRGGQLHAVPLDLLDMEASKWRLIGAPAVHRVVEVPRVTVEDAVRYGILDKYGDPIREGRIPPTWKLSPSPDGFVDIPDTCPAASPTGIVVGPMERAATLNKLRAKWLCASAWNDREAAQRASRQLDLDTVTAELHGFPRAQPTAWLVEKDVHLEDLTDSGFLVYEHKGYAFAGIREEDCNLDTQYFIPLLLRCWTRWGIAVPQQLQALGISC